nr:uracil-DNA glycosylase [Desulfobulbaceae bacterium]
MLIKTTRPNCFGCRHFFITHEPAHPYGCGAMAFKSKELPSTVVYKNSGLDCQMFTKKIQKKPIG